MNYKRKRTCKTAHQAGQMFGRADQEAAKQAKAEMRNLNSVWLACKAWEERNGIRTETSLYYGR